MRCRPRASRLLRPNPRGAESPGPRTGFTENDTLWDWLHLLLLPLIIATLPIWLEHGEYMDPRVRRLILSVVAAFAVLVALGYLVPWVWTGFTGVKGETGSLARTCDKAGKGGCQTSGNW